MSSSYFFASTILARLAVNQIIEHRVMIDLKPDHIWLSLGCALGGFFGGDIKAGSVIAQEKPGLVALAIERIWVCCLCAGHSTTQSRNWVDIGHIHTLLM